VGQLPKLFGVEKADGNVFVILWHLVGDLGDTNGWTLFVGVLGIAIVLSLRRWAPRVPASLVAVAVGIVLVALFDLDDDGVAIVGHVDSGLPSFGLPGSLALDDYLAAAAAAIGIMLVGFAEGLGAAKTYATKRHEEIDTNRELLGLGAANLAAAVSSGMVVNGSLSKTAVNASGGARSQLSGLFVAAMTVVTLLFLTGLFEDLPEATLAAVVICALVELVDLDALRELNRLRSRRFGRLYGAAARADLIAAVAAMVGVLVFDTLPGLVIGIATSFVLLIYRSSSPHIAELGHQPGVAGRYADLIRHPEDPTVPGVVVLRPEAGLFFANAEAVREAVVDAAGRDGVHAVVLDAESVPFIDVTALGVLVELGEVLAGSGVVLAVAHGIGQVTDVIDHGADESHLDLYPTVEAAVTALGPR
jgi:anti-anti-sigma factor